MNVTLEKKDDLNAIITVHLTKDDYEEKLNNQFREYRKKAKIPGFRPGTVPIGMVKQMIGKTALFEEVNKLTGAGLYDYLKENNIDILGQPIASAEKQSVTDFENYGDFTFYFDLGLAPIFDLNISTKDKLTRYEIEVDRAEVETEIKNLTRNYGKLENVEKSETENDSIVLLLTEVEADGTAKEGGIAEQEATVLPEVVKNEAIKKQLVGVSVGDALDLDIFELFNNNEMVIYQSLGITKEAVVGLNKTFKATVKEIRRVNAAELNQELFDQIMGKDAVTSVEEFEAKIEENLASYYQAEAERQLDAEVNKLLSESHKINLPDAFLKRWLVDTKPETYTAETIDTLYAQESVVLRKQLIREKIAEQESVEVTNEDIDQTSYAYTVQMLRQYGLANPDPALVQNFEAKNREEKSYLMRIRDVVVEKKVLDKVKELITISTKNISIENFYDVVKKFNESQG